MEFNNVTVEKKRVPVIVWVTVIVLVAVAGLVVGFLLTMNSGSSYRAVEANAFKEIIEQINATAESANENTAADFEMILKPLPKINEYLVFFGIPADTEFENSVFTGEVKYGEGTMYQNIAYLNAEEKIASVELFTNGGNIIYSLPEISNILLTMSYADEDAEGTLSAMPEFDSKAFFESMRPVKERYFEMTKDVTRERCELTLKNGQTVNTYKYDVEIDKEMALELAQLFLEQLLDNDNLMEIIESQSAKLTDELEEALVEVKESIAKGENDEGVISMTVYGDSKKLYRREIILPDSSLEICYENFKSATDYYTNIEADYKSDDNSGYVGFESKGTISGDNYSGNLKVTYSDAKNVMTAESVEIDYNINYTNTSNYSGTYSVKMPSALNFSVSGDVTVNKNDSNLSANVVYDGSELFGLEFIVKEKEFTEIVLPRIDDGNVLDIENASYDNEVYQQFYSDVMQFTEELKTKVNNENSSNDLIFALLKILNN